MPQCLSRLRDGYSCGALYQWQERWRAVWDRWTKDPGQAVVVVMVVG